MPTSRGLSTERRKTLKLMPEHEPLPFGARMTHEQELTELLRTVAQKGLRVIEHFKKQPALHHTVLNQFIAFTEQMHQVILTLLKNPEQIGHRQFMYWQDALNLTQTQFHHWLEGTAMPIKDYRFHSEEWLNNPVFNLLSQHYLLASEHMSSLVEHIQYNDKKTARRLQFFIRQYLDALSPTNFVHTNPEILAETVKSRGKNLLHGLHNLFSDLESGSSYLMIKMTDTNSYKLGENIACTAGKVIFRNEMMELIQYTPQTSRVKSIPLLIIPPWINKYYILDLSPHNSLVRWLVNQGISVFMISWVNPDARFAKKSLFDYVQEGPGAAIAVIQKQLQIKQVNTVGFCIGGTLLALLLAYNKAQQNASIRSATFLATMIDFSDPGDIAAFIDEQQIKKLEEQMDSKGYLSGEFMASSFNSLRANDLIWSFFIKNYLYGKNPAPFDILYWNMDSTNLPATMHSQYLRWMYLHNNLIKPGKIRLNGTPINIKAIDLPTFFLSTEKDHIAPWKTTYIGFQLMRGPKRFVLGGSGHIAGIINSPNTKKYHYRINNTAPAEPGTWFEDSVEHQGSWWPEWLKWLKSYSGRNKEAPNFNQLAYKPLMDAPGSYIFK